MELVQFVIEALHLCKDRENEHTLRTCSYGYDFLFKGLQGFNTIAPARTGPGKQ